MTHMQRSDAIF